MAHLNQQSDRYNHRIEQYLYLAFFTKSSRVRSFRASRFKILGLAFIGILLIVYIFLSLGLLYRVINKNQLISNELTIAKSNLWNMEIQFHNPFEQAYSYESEELVDIPHPIEELQASKAQENSVINRKDYFFGKELNSATASEFEQTIPKETKKNLETYHLEEFQTSNMQMKSAINYVDEILDKELKSEETQKTLAIEVDSDERKRNPSPFILQGQVLSDSGNTMRFQYTVSNTNISQGNVQRGYVWVQAILIKNSSTSIDYLPQRISTIERKDDNLFKKGWQFTINRFKSVTITYTVPVGHSIKKLELLASDRAGFYRQQKVIYERSKEFASK